MILNKHYYNVSLSSQSIRIMANKKSAPSSGDTRPLNPRKRPTQARAENTVHCIQQALWELVDEQGFAKTSTNQIAQRAGVSIGSLYQYFPNRESIALSLYERVAVISAQKMKNLAVELTDSPLAIAVPEVMEALLGLFEEYRVVLLNLCEEVPDLKTENLTISFERLIRGSIQMFILHHDNEVIYEEPERTGFFAENIILGSLRRYVVEQPRHTNREEFVNELSQLVIAYFKKAAI